MKKLLLSLATMALTVFSFGALSAPVYAEPVQCTPEQIAAGTSMLDCVDSTIAGDDFELTGILSTIINVIIGVVGFIAVVMMILGGISFITSQGDAAKVTKAKNTILYGVVGLIVAMLAFAIVNFVLGSIFSSSNG